MTRGGSQEAGSLLERPLGRVEAPKAANRLQTASGSFELKVAHKYARIWRASAVLMALLPEAKDAPKHSPRANDIEPQYADGLEYVTCRTCDLHSDWPSLFKYVVVRGTATFWFCDETVKDQSCKFEDPPSRVHKVKIERGDVIQLWPMVPHRVVNCTSMALLSAPIAPEDRFRGLTSMRNTEAEFIDMIKIRKHSDAIAGATAAYRL